MGREQRSNSYRREQQMRAWRMQFETGIAAMESERNQLRALGQRMFKALEEYADESHWAQRSQDGDDEEDQPDTFWVGEGNGPEMAQIALGLKKPATPHHYTGDQCALGMTIISAHSMGCPCFYCDYCGERVSVLKKDEPCPGKPAEHDKPPELEPPKVAA